MSVWQTEFQGTEVTNRLPPSSRREFVIHVQREARATRFI